MLCIGYKSTGMGARRRTRVEENMNSTVRSRRVKGGRDVCWTGTLTSVGGVQSRIAVADNLADYVQNGVQQYVFAVAGIDEKRNITGFRPQGRLHGPPATESL